MKKVILILVAGLLLSGNAYAGCIKGDCVNGQGTYTYSDGGKYVGEFKDGKHLGQGTFTWEDGDKYVGGWKKNKRHGQGTFTWEDGNKYVGGWKKNKRHGQGTHTWASGEKYVGEYKDDKRQGEGTFTRADGTVITAIWKKGEIKKLISRDTSAKNKVDKKIEIASMIDKAKNTCKELGFKEGTEKFSDCSLKLYSQSVELAAEQNKAVVMQPQSSGSNVMTIYDPVRDNRVLMNQGQRMLSGACTLGINC